MLQVPGCTWKLTITEDGQAYKARVSGLILDLNEDGTHLMVRRPIAPGELPGCKCPLAGWSGTDDALCPDCDELFLRIEPCQQAPEGLYM